MLILVRISLRLSLSLSPSLPLSLSTTGKPYNTQVDVYSFAITLLEIGCRDHRFVVAQFLERGVGPLGVAAVTATGHVGFRPRPKEAFVEAQPDLWAMASTLVLYIGMYAIQQ